MFRLELSFLPYELILISCHIPVIRGGEKKPETIKNAQKLIYKVRQCIDNYRGQNGLINQRCRNVRKSFQFPADECQRYRYDKPSRIDCANQTGAVIGVGFGKGDLTLLLRSPNLYWGSRIRADIECITGIRETYALPCHRIFFEKEGIKSVENYNLNVNPEYPLWVSYFLRPEYDGANAITFNQTRKPPVSGERMLKIVQKIASTLSLMKKEQSIQMFITYDNQRILVQGGFKNWHSAYQFQNELRNVPFINAVRSRPWIPVTRPYEIEEWKDLNTCEEKPTICKILMSMAGNSNAVNGAIQRIKQKFSERFDLKKSEIDGHMQAGFWSGVLTIETPNLRRLLYAILEFIVTEDAVKSVRTIPSLEAESEGYLEKDESGHAFGSNLPHNYSKPTLQGLKSVDNWTCPDNSPNSDKILLYQLFTRKYEAEWLAYNVKQTAMEWTSRLQLPRTFFFQRFMMNIEKECARIAKYMSNPEMQLVSQIPLHGLSDFARQASAVQAVYNEHLEGMQVTSLTDPDVRVGNHACLLPLMIQAVDRLMVQYMGYLKENELEGISRYRFPRTWYGISTTWTGHDLSIRTGTLLLQLPIYVRLVPGDVLPLICHEAAHFHFSQHFPFHKDLTLLTHKLPESEIDQLTESQKDFCRIYWQFTDNIKFCYDHFRPDFPREIAKKFEVKLQRVLHELFVDIIAGLIGSSGFFVCLARNNCSWINLLDIKTKQPRYESHLVHIGIRTQLGLWINEVLGVGKQWNEPLVQMSNFLTQQESQQEDQIYKLASKELIAIYENNKSFNDALSLALRIVIQRTGIVKQLVTFFTLHYEVNPLFFEYSSNCRPDSLKKYNSCADIVKSILKFDALLLNYEPKDVVAALELPVKENGINYKLRRPMFPIGNVWMSLIYSKTTAAEERTS